MKAIAAASGETRVELDVSGTRFVTTVAAITRFPRSVLAELWHQHSVDQSRDGGIAAEEDAESVESAAAAFPTPPKAKGKGQKRKRVAASEGQPNKSLRLILGRDAAVSGPLEVDGDPSLFNLILAYLRRGHLPVVQSVAQMQWLESEAEFLKLDELGALCRDAYKRLDTVKVVQLLNGQRNLSGMDMFRLNMVPV